MGWPSQLLENKEVWLGYRKTVVPLAAEEPGEPF